MSLSERFKDFVDRRITEVDLSDRAYGDRSGYCEKHEIVKNHNDKEIDKEKDSREIITTKVLAEYFDSVESYVTIARRLNEEEKEFLKLGEIGDEFDIEGKLYKIKGEEGWSLPRYKGDFWDYPERPEKFFSGNYAAQEIRNIFPEFEHRYPELDSDSVFRSSYWVDESIEVSKVEYDSELKMFYQKIQQNVYRFEVSRKKLKITEEIVISSRRCRSDGSPITYGGEFNYEFGGSWSDKGYF